MPLLEDNDFVFTNNLAFRRALTNPDTLDLLAEIHEANQDEMEGYIKSANNSVLAFINISDITKSKGLLALEAMGEMKNSRETEDG